MDFSLLLSSYATVWSNPEVLLMTFIGALGGVLLGAIPGCRTRRKFIIDGLAVFIRCNRHLVIVPFVAAAFRPHKRSVHQLPPERLVAVHKPQPAEDRQDQVSLHLLDLAEGCNGFANRIIAHDGDAVVGAAYAVVEVLFAAQIGAPVGEIDHVLPLHLFPYRLPLRFRIVQGDLRPYLLLAGLGIQHMATAVNL